MNEAIVLYLCLIGALLIISYAQYKKGGRERVVLVIVSTIFCFALSVSIISPLLDYFLNIESTTLAALVSFWLYIALMKALLKYGGLR